MHAFRPLPGLLRSAVLSLAVFGALPTRAQQLDSVHVFKWVPDGKQTVGSANRLVWTLHKQHAGHTTLKGEEMATVSEAVNEYQPSRAVPAALPDLAHLAMVFSKGRCAAFGVTGDLERLINLSDLSEYRISGWSQHLYVRALLADVLLAH